MIDPQILVHSTLLEKMATSLPDSVLFTTQDPAQIQHVHSAC